MEEPDEEDYSCKVNSGKVRWVLSKGLNLGKKILVTGFLVSSAPVVLPSLVFVSAIGLACSIPSGVFLVSYTGAEMLMSKLLPRPTYHPTHFWDHGIVLDTEEVEGRLEEEEENLLGETKEVYEMTFEMVEEDKDICNDEKNVSAENGYGKGVVKNGKVYYLEEREERRCFIDERSTKGDFGREQEEEGLLEDTKEGSEMNIVMFEEENIVNEEKGIMPGHNYGYGVVKEDEQSSEDPSNSADENGYGADNVRCLDKTEVAASGEPENAVVTQLKEPLEGESQEQESVEGCGVSITIEGIDKSDSDFNEFETPFEVTNVILEGIGDQNRLSDIEEEELTRETNGLLESIRDEGQRQELQDTRGECVEETQGGSNEVNQLSVTNFDKMETTVGNNNVSTTEKIEGDIEVKMDKDLEVNKDKHASEYFDSMDNGENEAKSTKDVRYILGGEGNHVSDSSAGEAAVGHNGDIDSVPSMMEEEQKSRLDRPVTYQQGRPEITIGNDVNQNIQFHRDGEIMNSSYADSRENADESGFDFFNQRTPADQESLYTPHDVNEDNASYTEDNRANYVELPLSYGAHDSTHDEASSVKHSAFPSDEADSSEAKIWEKIEAMRTIVGYKGVTQASCMEELRALYLFTGVEPPASSFNDPLDLAQVKKKLRFLMSIIGVKY